MSYLISESTGDLIAVSPINLPTNTVVICADNFIDETMYGDIELSPSTGSIRCYVSNAKKWGNIADKNCINNAKLINDETVGRKQYEMKICS